MISENKLLQELKIIALKGPIIALSKAPNSVFGTFKNEMKFNKSNYKNFKYKGYKIRTLEDDNSNKLVNLFSRVPAWKLSECKDSNEILNNYGYKNPLKSYELSLFCTLNTLCPNTLGLQLELDREKGFLHENFISSSIKRNVCSWTFKDLKDGLDSLGKVVNVIANKISDKNNNFFHYRYAKISSKPSFDKFLDLLEEGSISLDHAISREKGKSAREQGPKFRIRNNSFDRLFPVKIYKDLLDD